MRAISFEQFGAQCGSSSLNHRKDTEEDESLLTYPARINRPVSFSPLETAKAFESPMFAAYNSNSSGRDLAKSTKNIRVQYGVKSTGATGEGEKLAFASPDLVSVPRNGSRFDP